MKFLLLFFISFYAFAEDPIENQEYYSDILRQHANQGHLSEKDIQQQKFFYEKDKAWRKDFNRKIRGIASTLKAPKDVIELDNPAIEIPVK